MDISSYGDTWKVWRALKSIALTLLVALQTSRIHPKLTHTKDEVILNLKMRKLLLQLLTAQITKCPDHYILLDKLNYKDDMSSDK